MQNKMQSKIVNRNPGHKGAVVLKAVVCSCELRYLFYSNQSIIYKIWLHQVIPIENIMRFKWISLKICGSSLRPGSRFRIWKDWTLKNKEHRFWVYLRPALRFKIWKECKIKSSPKFWTANPGVKELQSWSCGMFMWTSGFVVLSPQYLV